jgi:hypothetical protein
MTFSEPYKNFLLSLWLQCKLTEEQVAQAVTKGKITQAEADEILATPRVCP